MLDTSGGIVLCGMIQKNGIVDTGNMLPNKKKADR
jgi:hypothetical protein